jgi:hypothetical protein
VKDETLAATLGGNVEQQRRVRGEVASVRVDASRNRQPERPRIPLQEDEEEMTFVLVVAVTFALAALRRCVYIAEFYPLSLIPRLYLTSVRVPRVGRGRD